MIRSRSQNRAWGPDTLGVTEKVPRSLLGIVNAVQKEPDIWIVKPVAYKYKCVLERKALQMIEDSVPAFHMRLVLLNAKNQRDTLVRRP